MKLYWGNNLRVLRNSKNLTQGKLGEKIGIKGNTFSQYENGGYPKVEIVLKIAQFFNINLHHLFYSDIRRHEDLINNEDSIYQDKEVDVLRNENKLLKARLKDKEEIIELLRGKLSNEDGD